MEGLSDQRIHRMSQFLTTEHFTLQGARNATISEANGRLGHYISIVGSSVVALAFVANVSRLGILFMAFSTVIFPVMIVLGVATLIRTLQIGVDYARLVQAINRIRHFYIEAAPETAPYLSFTHFDDLEAVQQSMMPFQSSIQGIASTPGPIILLNSVLVGAFAGIVTVGFLGSDFRLAIGLSTLALIGAFALHTFYASRIWNRMTRDIMEARFPSPSS